MATQPSTTSPPPSSTSTSASDPPHPSQRTLRIGTRSSALALAQVDIFTSLLQTTHKSLTTSTHPSHTNLGDTNKVTDLHTLASTGKSLWTEDLERELAENRIDIIVHSMKDVPTQLPPGFICAAIGSRDEARDAVIMNERGVAQGWKSLAQLPSGGVVGTSSVRRAAMIRRSYPHLRVENVRGNVPTRIRKVDDAELGFDALVLAGAGVQRLGMGERVSSWLGGEEGVLHAVGQGAVGVELRVGDVWVAQLLEEVGVSRGSRRVRWEIVGERSLLRALEGGCSVPVGVDCVWDDDDAGVSDGAQASSETQEDSTKENEGYEADDALPQTHTDRAHGGFLTMRAMVVSTDGKQCVQGSQRQRVSSDREAEDLSFKLYKELVNKGAEDILKNIRLNRGMIEAQHGA